MSRKNKKVRMSSRIDLADALRKESSLSAFTFDGPYRLTCWTICTVLITGGGMKPRWTGTVWQELPGKRPGISLRFILSAMYCSVATSRTRCFPGRISRRWRWTDLCSVTHSLSFEAICSANRLNYGTPWRNTCDAEAILNHGGMCRMARMRFSFAQAKCVT